jgi:hypothetical protein
MASEISHRHSATAKNLYATIRNTARQMWNTSGTPAFEALTVANWTDYDIALSETPASSYFYVGTFPAISGNMVSGWYWIDIFERAGANPAIGDALLASYFGYWDGTTYKWWSDDAQVVSDKTGFKLASDGLDAVVKMKALLDGTPSGKVVDDASNSATTFKTDLANTTDDFAPNGWLLFTSGDLQGQAQPISGYNGTTKFVTVATAFTAEPSADDEFLIIGRKQ